MIARERLGCTRPWAEVLHGRSAALIQVKNRGGGKRHTFQDPRTIAASGR